MNIEGSEAEISLSVHIPDNNAYSKKRISTTEFAFTTDTIYADQTDERSLDIFLSFNDR